MTFTYNVAPYYFGFDLCKGFLNISCAEAFNLSYTNVVGSTQVPTRVRSNARNGTGMSP
jgi:hypothetical protein